MPATFKVRSYPIQAVLWPESHVHEANEEKLIDLPGFGRLASQVPDRFKMNDAAGASIAFEKYKFEAAQNLFDQNVLANYGLVMSEELPFEKWPWYLRACTIV
eukprot:SAG11_NODE_13371_length_658_cov_0.847943_2_plen_103_part_00